MQDITYETRLLAEHYDVQPHAIVWMRPLYDPAGKEISDFEFTYSNEEGLRYLNLSREQFTGLFLSNSPTLTTQFRKAVFEEMLTVYNTGKKSETTVFNAALNKHAKVVRSRLHHGVLTVVQDITAEKRVIGKLEQQAQQLEAQTRQLQEQKTLLDNILKNSSNGISVSEVFRDESGKVVDALTVLANEAAVKFIGLPKELYLTRRATEIEPSIMDSPYYQACINTLETGNPFLMQYQMQSTGRWLELTVSKLDYNHLIQVFTDVTPIREAQLQVEKAANILRLVFDAAQTGMFTFTPVYNDHQEIVDFRFLMANSAISAYVNETPEALIGETGSKWFPGYLTNGVFEMCKHTFETGEPHRKEVHYKGYGHDNYFDLQTVKIDEQLLVTTTDHTTLRKSQLQLQETVNALERSNNYLEDFAYAASHDMKEPIRKVLNFTGRLKVALLSRMTDKESALVEKIENTTKRMQLLVDDLLDFSDISAAPRELEAVDVNEKIRQVLFDLELAIAEKQAQVIITNRLPLIKGNKRQMQQLFQNLIANALKYSKPDTPPVITISTRIINKNDGLANHFPAAKEKAFHLITITDNGIGFQQQYAEQIFEMFKRLHGRTSYSGTGIGLAIARKVVENHSGYIWAESEEGKGATFNLLLPVFE